MNLRLTPSEADAKVYAALRALAVRRGWAVSDKRADVWCLWVTAQDLREIALLLDDDGDSADTATSKATADKPDPSPQAVVSAVTCSACGLAWEQHGPDPTFETCIELLKAALIEKSAVQVQWGQQSVPPLKPITNYGLGGLLP